MNKMLSAGVKVLLIASLLVTSACASVANPLKKEALRPIPPVETSAEAASFKDWRPSRAIGFRVHRGFDAEGTLIEGNNKMTYREARALEQLKVSCAKIITTKINNVGMVQLSEAVKSTSLTTGGAIVGTYLGIPSPTIDTVRQISGISAGTAGGGSIYGADLNLRIMLDSAYAQCVIESAKRSDDELGRVVLFSAPLLTFDAEEPLAPGVPEPVDN